jgi:hypothetical protein
MFGWLRNSCPIDPVTRAWIEQRYRWLTSEFGSDLMINSPTILPTNHFFPDRYDRTDQTATAMVNRVCDYMGVDPATIDLQFFTDKTQNLVLVNDEGHALGGTAGTYRRGDSKFVIRIERSQFHDPMELVGTVAHELSHVLLLGGDRLDRDSFDNEILTDLTVVFHGLGIFLANHPRHWRSAVTTWPGTDVPKPQYMTTPMYGYAMAYRSWLREEVQARWSRHLRSGVRAEFRQSTRFLNAKATSKP